MAKEDALAWIAKSRSDFKVAKYNLDGEMLDAAAFYCEQAVEKALKAAIILRSNEVSKTHELVALSKQVGAPKSVQNLCAKITPAYTVARYPDVGGGYTRKDVEEIFEASKEVLKWVEKEFRF